MSSRNRIIVYVMHLLDNKYYVGMVNKTEDLRNICNTVSSKFTNKYKPLSILSSIGLQKKTGISYKTIFTLKYMQKYGIDNVRGGGYSEIEITPSSRENIQHYFSHLPNLCNEPDDNLDVLKLYEDAYTKAKFIQYKLYKCHSEFGLNYGELKRRVSEYENNEEFLQLNTSFHLTRSKKQKIFSDIPFV